MKTALVVIDMQNDFVDGALGTQEALSIVTKIKEKIKVCRNKNYDIIFTKDTHRENYLITQEGQKLPVSHCIINTKGWQICKDIIEDISESDKIFEKSTFGSIELAKDLMDYDIVELCGVCTDICVISNAVLIKSFSPETKIVLDRNCVAGVTPQLNNDALSVMKSLQIEVL